MEIKQALSHVIERSGMSRYAVGQRLGKGRNYMYNLLAKPTNPTFGVIVDVADVCGYDLALVNREDGDVIKLDPPDR